MPAGTPREARFKSAGNRSKCSESHQSALDDVLQLFAGRMDRGDVHQAVERGVELVGIAAQRGVGELRATTGNGAGALEQLAQAGREGPIAGSRWRTWPRGTGVTPPRQCASDPNRRRLLAPPLGRPLDVRRFELDGVFALGADVGMGLSGTEVVNEIADFLHDLAQISDDARGMVNHQQRGAHHRGGALQRYSCRFHPGVDFDLFQAAEPPFDFRNRPLGGLLAVESEPEVELAFIGHAQFSMRLCHTKSIRPAHCRKEERCPVETLIEARFGGPDVRLDDVLERHLRRLSV
jgi:hypothetical protein